MYARGGVRSLLSEPATQRVPNCYYLSIRAEVLIYTACQCFNEITGLGILVACEGV
ncbi:hypothetical protein GCM10008012_55160 [Rhizobium anhuiense]|nr:hypothetical protein GCM10008012_55160 [Rhizobium anhuiense]